MAETEPPKHGIPEETLQTFLDNGVPEDALPELRSTPGIGMGGGIFAAILFVGLMLVLMVPGILTYTPLFADLLNRLGVLPADTLLVELNYFSPIAFIFLSIFLAGWILSSLTALNPGLDRRMAIWTMKQMVDPNQQYSGAQLAFLRFVAKRAVRLQKQDGFLRAFNRASRRLYFMGVASILAIGLFFLWWDYHSMTLVDPEGISVSGYWEMERRTLSWEEATALQIGCETTHSDGKKEFSLHYIVTFQDGTERNLAGYFQAVSLRRVDALDLIDNLLREEDTSWEWIPGDQRPEKGGYEECYESFRKNWSKTETELEAFNRVFRQDS